MRTAAFAGLVGGACWLVRPMIGDDGVLPDVLPWVGLALIAVALAGFGAGLVSSSATWLRLIVAVCVLLLAWSVLEVLRDNGDATVVDAAFGGVVVLGSLIALARLLRRGYGRDWGEDWEEPEAPSAGRHSAAPAAPASRRSDRRHTGGHRSH